MKRGIEGIRLGRARVVLLAALAACVFCFAGGAPTYAEDVAVTDDGRCVSARDLAAQDATAPDTAAVADDPIRYVQLGVGANETCRDFNWLSLAHGDTYVEYAEVKPGYDVRAGMPEQGVQRVPARQNKAQRKPYYTNKAEVSGLKANASYVYRVGCDEAWSQPAVFTTGGQGDDAGFSFVFAGDPQLGSGDDLSADQAGWAASAAIARDRLHASFMVSAGDQVDAVGPGAALNRQYDAYFAAPALQGLSMATTAGNHDFPLGRTVYTDYTNMPNYNAKLDDYWFSYNGVLFIDLNSNALDTAAHEAFMRQALEQNPNASWKIVMFHHSIFSAGNHGDEPSIMSKRKQLAPMMSELGIDAVLMGHDHHYTRSQMMQGVEPVIAPGHDVSKGEPAPTEAVAVDGQVLYLTASSSSGSKFYGRNDTCKDGLPAWAAADSDCFEGNRRPQLIKVDVTADSLTFTAGYTDAGAFEPFDTFTLRRAAAPVAPHDPDAIKDVELAVGAREDARNFNWLSKSSHPSQVAIAQVDAAFDPAADPFPKDARTADAVTAPAARAGYSSNKASVEGLRPNARYAYRVGNEEGWSEVAVFATGAFGGEEAFNFLFAGDPQIGSTNIAQNTAGWADTLQLAETQLAPEFVVSAGDQVEHNEIDSLYDDFFSAPSLRRLPLATTLGNHDDGASRYSDYTNMPNMTAYAQDEQTGSQSGDYWYRYNGLLVLDLNSNVTDAAVHERFVREATEANPDASWKIAVFHHSIFSMGIHGEDEGIIERRKALAPLFSRYGIDAVLMGHDHIFTRTHMMNGLDPVNRGDDVALGAHVVPQPGDVMYVTANSASGSKFYGKRAGEPAWLAHADQSRRKSITNVVVTPRALTIDTYFASNGALEKMDSIVLERHDAVGPEEPETNKPNGGTTAPDEHANNGQDGNEVDGPESNEESAGSDELGDVSEGSHEGSGSHQQEAGSRPAGTSDSSGDHLTGQHTSNQAGRQQESNAHLAQTGDGHMPAAAVIVLAGMACVAVALVMRQRLR